VISIPTPLLLKAAPYAIAAVMAGGWYAKHNYAEREIGRRDLLLTQSEARGDSAEALATLWAHRDSLDAARAAQLGKALAAAQRISAARDSTLSVQRTALADARHALDLAIRTPAVTGDTLSTRLGALLHAFELQSDSTLKACVDARDAKASVAAACALRAAALEARVTDLTGESAANRARAVAADSTADLVRGAVPSGLRTWTERTVSAGVGLFSGWLAWHRRLK